MFLWCQWTESRSGRPKLHSKPNWPFFTLQKYSSKARHHVKVKVIFLVHSQICIAPFNHINTHASELSVYFAFSKDLRVHQTLTPFSVSCCMVSHRCKISFFVDTANVCCSISYYTYLLIVSSYLLLFFGVWCLIFSIFWSVAFNVYPVPYPNIIKYVTRMDILLAL